MILRQTAAGVLALFSLSACASLRVEVDVLKPSYVEEITLNESFRNDAAELWRGENAELDLFISTQRALYIKQREACLRQAAANVRTLPASAQRDLLASSLEDAIDAPDLVGQIDPMFAQVRLRLRGVDDRVRDVIGRGYADDLDPAARPVPLPADLRAALIERRESYRQEAVDLYDAVAGQTLFCPGDGLNSRFLPSAPPAPAAPQPTTAEQKVLDASAETTAGAQQKALAAADQVITGSGILLLNRAEAWAVVSAPESAWAPRYNQAYVRGYGGGTDVAIKLNSTGDFSVKGFAFDGRATANMVAKVGGQAVRLVATAYGYPAAGGSGSGGGSSDTTSAAEKLVSQQRTDIITAEQEAKAYRAALFRVADAILANPTALFSGGNPVVTAAPKAAFDAHMSAWKPADN